jgi:glycine cleavage system H protein
MSEFLELKVDKFTFQVAQDRYYTSEGLWVKPEDNWVRIGLSDFLQQRSGDVAFAEVRSVGTRLVIGEEVAVIETIKVNISLGSPVNGTVAETNPAMEISPEAINQDPYGSGWLALIHAVDWEGDRARLMDARNYFEHIKIQAEEASP